MEITRLSDAESDHDQQAKASASQTIAADNTPGPLLSCLSSWLAAPAAGTASGLTELTALTALDDFLSGAALAGEPVVIGVETALAAFALSAGPRLRLLRLFFLLTAD